MLLTNMQHAVHGFPTRQAWTAFTDTLSSVVARNLNIVWKDKVAQAWFLHKAMIPKSVLDCLPAMQGNCVYEFLTIRQSLDATCTVLDCYLEWCHMQMQPLESMLDIGTFLTAQA